MTKYIMCIYQGRIQDFLWGGANPHWRGRQPPTQVLFDENICKNERIWSCWGGRTLGTFVCRSATVYWGHMFIFIPNMKFLSSILWLGGLSTDANNTDDDTNDTDNYARQSNHDYIGSFGRIPNEPKS